MLAWYQGCLCLVSAYVLQGRETCLVGGGRNGHPVDAVAVITAIDMTVSTQKGHTVVCVVK